MPTAELLLQLSQPAFTLHHPTYKPGDPLDPELPGTEPSHHSLHIFPAGLAEDIMSFSRHSLRPAFMFANDTHHHVSTGSAPICPVSEPTSSSLQDHDGYNDNVPPLTTRTTNPTVDDGSTQVGGPQQIEYINAPTIDENNVHPTTCIASGPQESNGPRAMNHSRKMRRRNKRKAARMSSSQAQKKTHAMSSGRGPIIGSSFSRRRQASLLLGKEYTTQDTQHYLKRKSTHTFGMNSTTVGQILLGRIDGDGADEKWREWPRGCVVTPAHARLAGTRPCPQSTIS
ncbi:hypothetical protein THAOC_04527 [Thalassiosira oceanica]|uniref:Uncharacterized protein n=1 Tax=Thalassiosira oceanica TaxID=159749 RepID=K0T8B9_THAOC|nr:hypothetical protein THAOC_04527 [Thalassiosira oceanica]|eukprot:EJK73830.1 hypothetical protein THAOC_04527 [Thalassiosira oceanica]